MPGPGGARWRGASVQRLLLAIVVGLERIGPRGHGQLAQAGPHLGVESATAPPGAWPPRAGSRAPGAGSWPERSGRPGADGGSSTSPSGHRLGVVPSREPAGRAVPHPRPALERVAADGHEAQRQPQTALAEHRVALHPRQIRPPSRGQWPRPRRPTRAACACPWTGCSPSTTRPRCPRPRGPGSPGGRVGSGGQSAGSAPARPGRRTGSQQ